MNLRSDKNTEFFGVQLELWKIGNSCPAPYFNLIVTPNNWQRETRRSLLERELSAKEKKYQAFFQILLDRLREIGFSNTRRAQPTFQCVFPSGFGATFRYKTNFATGGKARVELYIDSGQKSRNFSIFNHIQESKEKIERDIGDLLNWEELPDRRACRIALYRDGTIDDEDAVLESIRSWMEQKLVAFKTNFQEVLKGVALDEHDETDLP